MSGFSHGPITQIETTSPRVFAFRITGHLDDDASEALAEFMNKVFDDHNGVTMLLDLTGFTGSDWDSMLDGDVLRSRFRALGEVERYAVVGAPKRAAQLIGYMDKIIPVEARAFNANEMDEAWAFVGARPTARG
jgi:hypothetical protein